MQIPDGNIVKRIIREGATGKRYYFPACVDAPQIAASTGKGVENRYIVAGEAVYSPTQCSERATGVANAITPCLAPFPVRRHARDSCPKLEMSFRCSNIVHQLAI